MKLKLSAEEFYNRRDNRTNRLTDNREYQNFFIRLSADTSTINSYAGQVQLLAAANMLARWCRHVELGFADAPLLKKLQINGYQTLHERILAEITAADPFGSFTITPSPSSDVQYTLQVGKASSAQSASFTINGSGWVANAGTVYKASKNPNSDENPIGPVFAACIGVADAFKVATGLPAVNRVSSVSLSLFDFSINRKSETPHCPEKVRIGKVQLIGAGSVGSAIAYVLRMIPTEGDITIIDHDPIEIENLNRSPIFGVESDGKSKADIVSEYLKNHVEVTSFGGRYDEYIRVRGRKPGDIDLIIPAANEFNVRADIENNFPVIQIYGTTTSSWGINYHRHIPFFNEDCSVCRFPPLDSQPDFPCSTAQVETQHQKPIDAALPFLSVGAGVLTVADLIKLQLPGYPFTPNFALVDLFGPLDFLVNYDRHPKELCMCKHRSLKIHEEFIRSTSFSSLSFIH